MVILWQKKKKKNQQWAFVLKGDVQCVGVLKKICDSAATVQTVFNFYQGWAFQA